MLNGYMTGDSKQSTNLIDDQFISIITALFIEGLAIEKHMQHSQGSPLQRFSQWARPENRLDLALCCTKETETIALKEYGTRKAEPRNKNRRNRTDQTTLTLRNFILGLSDAFNNLLMGIWGNLSLINLSTDKADPIYARVSEMEQLIQNGSALLNGIFGYLGERRIVAKNIRLNQLIREINESIPIDSDLVKRHILQASKADHGVQNTAALIASGLARVLMQFMGRIQHHYHVLQIQSGLPKENINRLRHIDRLIKRALDIILRLQYYAGIVAKKAEKLSVKRLTEQVARKIEKGHPYLKISVQMARRLPRIHADRSMLYFVLKELMENAAAAMSENGDLRVDLRALGSEKPQNRCVAYRWADSIVLTITDSGHGMDLDTLLHVFDPFFTGRGKSSHLGMGLAACWGIIKTHGGYIHVRSKAGASTTFKVYLPIG